MTADKVRLDTLLAQRGLFPSRARAAASVMAGEVRLGSGGARAAKPGQMVAQDVELAVDEARRHVSRGGTKLENALDALGLDVAGRRALDVGASTGGFTDCLLQRGATHVIALDVAYGELAWSLREDPRVTVAERRNARDLRPGELEYEPDLVVADVSFISLTKVLPAVLACCAARVRRARDGQAAVRGRPHPRRQGRRRARSAAAPRSGRRRRALRAGRARRRRPGLRAVRPARARRATSRRSSGSCEGGRDGAIEDLDGAVELVAA